MHSKIYDKHLLPRDFLGVLLFMFIIGSMTLFGPYKLRILGLVVAGCFALYFLKEKKSFPVEFLIYSMWLLWSLSGYVVSADKSAFLTTFLTVFNVGVMGFTISGITAQRTSMKTNFLGLIIGGLIQIVLSLFSNEFGQATDPANRMRVTGLVDNSNHYAFILLTAIFALLYFLGRKNSLKGKLMLSILLVIFIFGIILSASRKTLIGVTLLILLWFWMCYKKELLRRPSLLLSLAGITAGFFVMGIYIMSSSYIGERISRDYIDVSYRTAHIEDRERRFALYEEGLEMLTSNPIFGVGLGNFAIQSAYGQYAHSEYMELLACTGIIGFLMYSSIYVVLWRRLSKLQKVFLNDSISKELSLLKAAILTLLVIALGRPNFISINAWVFISSAIGYAFILERKITSSKTRLKQSSFEFSKRYIARDGRAWLRECEGKKVGNVSRLNEGR